MMIKIVIPIEPVPKGRPRATLTKNGKMAVYTPGKTAHAENLIRDWVIARVTEAFPERQPLFVEATFSRPRPKSNKDPLPVGKPDVDNMEKLLLDALEGFLWPNDSQITTMVTRKRWGPPQIKLNVMPDVILNEDIF